MPTTPCCPPLRTPQDTETPFRCSLSWELARLSGPALCTRVREHTADLTIHGNTKAILCRRCRFSTLSLTYKTRLQSHTDQPRTLPPMHCPCKSFSPPCRSLRLPWQSEWLCYSRCVCLFLSLTHFSSLLFFSSSLSQSQHQPDLFC